MPCIIELEIAASSNSGEFVTSVVNAPSGSGSSEVVQLDVDRLLNERDSFENMVLASAVSKRTILSGHEKELRRVGAQLFNALFSGTVLGTYRASCAIAHERGEPLRVVLRLTQPRLAALPWEALFDPENEAYICRQEPLVRQVPAPHTREPLHVTLPLRVLGLVASPRGLPDLDVAAEQKHLRRALATPIRKGLIELDWLAPAKLATWGALQEKLMSNQWHVLHFIGHGDYDTTNDRGVIALVGDDGRADHVEAGHLADLLKEAQPMPRLVVLNSCSSGAEGTKDLFSGVAAALVRRGVSAVAAMQFTVSDSAAIDFARGFYTAIGHGRSIDDATRSGRISVLGARTLEWVTPVLYVRGDNTQLFAITERPPNSAPSGPPAPGRAPSPPQRNRRKKMALAATAIAAVALVATVLIMRTTTAPGPVQIPTVNGMYTGLTDNGKNFTITLSTVCDGKICTAHVVTGWLGADAPYNNELYQWVWDNPTAISCLDGSTAPGKQKWSLNPVTLIGSIETESVGPVCGRPSIKYENGFQLLAPPPASTAATPGPSPTPTPALPPMPIQTVTPAKLDSILLTTEEINTVMGSAHMEVKKTAQDLASHAPSVSDPTCFGAIYSGEQSVYAPSRPSGVRYQELQDSDRFYVDQTAVAFPSADQARAFLTTSAVNWNTCAGRTVTTPSGVWTVGQLEGADPNIAQLSTRADGWACQHAISTVSNAIVEVKACGHQISDEASRLSAQMVAKASA
jgi:hypothetical protein